MKNTVRVNVSVPIELKAQMEAYPEPVNWSAVAVEAFCARLGQPPDRQSDKVRSLSRRIIDRLEKFAEELERGEEGRDTEAVLLDRYESALREIARSCGPPASGIARKTLE